MAARRRDPYAILVSEVMLQQTQVDRVIPRWRRWLERWPTVEALAAATPAEVIVEWQGLGYNRRAVSLHRAARVVAEQRLAGRPDRAARRRALHRGGGRELRVRARRAAGGHERPPGAAAHRRGVRRRRARRRSSTSARRCASRASPVAGPARSPPPAPRAGSGTSRCGGSPGSRDRSGSDAPSLSDRSPPGRRPPISRRSSRFAATAWSRSPPTVARRSPTVKPPRRPGGTRIRASGGCVPQCDPRPRRAGNHVPIHARRRGSGSSAFSSRPPVQRRRRRCSASGPP